MKRMLIIAASCLFLLTPVTAQKQEMPRRSCRDCKVTKEYDRFKDQTTLTLVPMPVADVVDGKMYISLAAGYKGQVAAGATKAYVIAIIFIAKTALGASDPELFALVNGKPESFGDLTLTRRDSVSYLQTVTYSKLIEPTIISKIGRADKVEMRFGGIEFQLTTDQRNAILDFLNDLDGDPNHG